MSPSPLEPEDFAALMAPLGPFEARPRLAVACSGGADSTALAVLADGWARGQGGSITALTVDHRLRTESAAEAARVGRRLAALGIDHEILTLAEALPRSNRQAAARAARYRRLVDWCRDRGVLHLLVAHHLDDQAETLLLRVQRGASLHGLAGMSAITETAGPRLLRPLLGVRRSGLVETLRARGVDWEEDPSNHDKRYDRVRMRSLLARLEEDGLDEAVVRLAMAARRLGHLRQEREAVLARLLARAVAIDPAGHAWLDPGPLLDAPRAIALRALSDLLTTIGGGSYAPRLERLERLYDRLAAPGFAGATLAGCRVLPRRRGVLIAREEAACADLALSQGGRVHWDGRFGLDCALPRGERGLRLAAMGEEGWRQAGGEIAGDLAALPAPVRRTWPGLWRGDRLLEAPCAGWRRADEGVARIARVCFWPRRGLTSAAFTVVNDPRHIM